MTDSNSEPDITNGGNVEPESAQIDLDELRRRFDTEARTRTLSGWEAKMALLGAVSLSVFHFYTSGFGLLLAIKQRAVHLALVLFMVYMLYPFPGRPARMPCRVRLSLGGVAAYVVLYHVIYFNEIVMRAGLPTPWTSPSVSLVLLLLKPPGGYRTRSCRE